MTTDSLVLEHRPMAERLARRYSHGNVVDADLGQVADMALFLAADRYDPAVGPFRPFAMATIVGELKKHLRSNGWAVRVPRRLQEASITVATATENLEQSLQRSPTPQDISDATGMPLEQVLQALQARGARFAAEPTEQDQRTQIVDFEAVASSIDVRSAQAELTPQAQELIRLRFHEELTQRQIADRLEISQSQVHRRLSSALKELREALSPGTEMPDV